MKKCLVIGAVTLDIIMQINTLPKTGDDVYASAQEMRVGGCAYNAADILKHFRIPYTLFSPIGTGLYSRIISGLLKQSDHNSPIHLDKGDNGYSLCLVEKSGERTFINLAGVECSFKSEWFEKIKADVYDSVYVCGYEIEGDGGENIIDFLENNSNLTIYYAPGPRISYISEEKNRRIFSLNPVIHLNEKEAAEYTRQADFLKAAQSLYKRSNNVVIITLGERGAYYYDGNSGSIFHSEKTRVVDTIGAGDSHIGTILAMRQSGHSWEESIKLANMVSRMVVGVSGSTLSENEFIWKEYKYE